ESIGHFVQIVPYVGLPRVQFAPVLFLSKTIAVCKIRCIEATPRINVLPPGTTKSVIFLPNFVRNASLLKLYGRSYPRDSCTDDEDWKTSSSRVRGCLDVGMPRDLSHFMFDHVNV